MKQTVINLEQGAPTVAQARAKLDQALRAAKSSGVCAVKIIHGYGSSGKGGAIKQDVQVFLRGKLRAKVIRGFVPGERFSPFDAQAREMLGLRPELAKDKDYARGNDGVTIVLL